MSSSFDVITNNLFPGFCLRGRETKAPDFKSQLLANDKSDFENCFSSRSPLIRLSRKMIFAEPVVAL